MNKLHSNKLALNAALTAQYLQNDFGYPSEPLGYAGYRKKYKSAQRKRLESGNANLLSTR